MGLEMVEILMDVEDHFQVEISDDSLSQCRTFGDLVAVVADAVRKQRPDVQNPEGEADEFLRDELIAEFAIPSAHITKDASLYADLGLG